MATGFIYNHNSTIKLSVPNSYKWQAARYFCLLACLLWVSLLIPSNITCRSLSPRCEMRLNSDMSSASSSDKPAPWTLHRGTARRREDARIQTGRRRADRALPGATGRAPPFLKELHIQACHLPTGKRNGEFRKRWRTPSLVQYVSI